MKIFYILSLWVSVFLIEQTRQEGCTINVIENYPRDSLVVNTNTYEVLYPPIENEPGNQNISIDKENTIIISCPAGRFSSFSGLEIKSRTVYATCNQNFQLETQDNVIDFFNISCVTYEPTITQSKNEKCNFTDSTVIEIGFQIGVNIKLLPQIVVCFDTVKQIPLYTFYNLTKSIGFTKSYLVTSYSHDIAYYNLGGQSLESLYDLMYEVKTINALLGASENSTEYINPDTCATTPGFCLVMGQVVDRSSFVYLLQQYATYHYINTAPIWSFVYEYNWYRLTRNIIDYVKSSKIDLQVYTGTYGIATLPHEITGEETELYLYLEDENRLPVPKLLWKILYDPYSFRATVFLTVNNPHQLNESDIICDDISESINWLTWEKTNATKGYSYACSYEEVKQKISYLPELIVQDILF